MLSALFIAFPGNAYSKDKILIGTAIALSGPFAGGAAMTQVPNYDLWVDDVNAKGGIYVMAYKKRLPVELIKYDTKSDVGTAVKLVQKLILEDKVDFLLPPWGTGTNLAVAPVFNKYKYPLIGPTVTSEKLREKALNFPYLFIMLQMPREQGAAIVGLFKDLRIKRVALIYTAAAYGIEHTNVIKPMLSEAGIKVDILKNFPMGTPDLMPLLKEIKAANVDALLGFTYPPNTFLITQQAKVIGLNPKVFYLSVGVAFPSYKGKFGAAMVEGVMGPGVWNPNVPYPGAKEYFDRHVKQMKKEPDRWASAFSYAGLQVLEQAIVKVGSLDREKIRDVLATGTFTTVVGPVKFDGMFNVQSPGEVGQWQNGEFEVVAAKEKRTASPIVPKPPWP
jgi:branched-chain amino acid transport system substrate-binding protein